MISLDNQDPNSCITGDQGPGVGPLKPVGLNIVTPPIEIASLVIGVLQARRSWFSGEITQLPGRKGRERGREGKRISIHNRETVFDIENVTSRFEKGNASKQHCLPSAHQLWSATPFKNSQSQDIFQPI